MNNKLYFYFKDTNYFGHNPHQKFLMIENNKEYNKFILTDPDCISFDTGGKFYAVVTSSTFIPPTNPITCVDTFIGFVGVCMIVKCSNYNVEQYYRSNIFYNNHMYNQLMTIIRTIISNKN